MKTNFEAFKTDLAEVIRQNDKVCKEGYKALLSVSDFNMLCAVIRKYWSDLNGTLWPQFQILLQKHYTSVHEDLEKRGIHYNTFCSSGLCIVDKYCEHERLLVRGMAEVVCHENGKVKLIDQASALMLDDSDAVARDASIVDARNRSFVDASGYCTVRAFDNAKIISDGATQLYLYDNVQVKIIRYRKIEQASTVTILSPFSDFK